MCPNLLYPPLSDHERILFEDLTPVPPEVAAVWIEHFKAQAAQTNFWEEDALDKFGLGLRTVIAQARRAPSLVVSDDLLQQVDPPLVPIGFSGNVDLSVDTTTKGLASVTGDGPHCFAGRRRQGVSAGLSHRF